MAVILPGDESTPVTWVSEQEHFLGTLIDIENNHIVDTEGNRIMLDGGYDEGDNPDIGIWTSGDML